MHFLLHDMAFLFVIFPNNAATKFSLGYVHKFSLKALLTIL